ncbi:immune inhibitor A domain-containing protein [Chengkuizengella axinellae]|uniref:Immune inhibitor A n=1 Tax=Chengkuizengella axinellae TaxID=3064388 RepID=A0ABT9J4F6_9BACL|nr:immune inhibitor A domain-containing protein [Chengkuizengella sp. 2205SS18-9]MDP5276438.1 immune inhibitor A [Chengkuizengella sp. 2205SS18-9]
MRKKVISAISTAILSASLIVPSFSGVQVSAATPNINTERYGDVMDIGSELRQQSEDLEFLQSAEEKLIEQSIIISGNEEAANSESDSESDFTFDGGTKYFLNRDLQFKTFTLRSVGDNVEVWIADDLSFPEGDERPAHVITQEQADKMRDEFEGNIYPKVVDFFGEPDTLTGENATLPGIVGFEEDYYVSEEGKNIILVDNIIDDQYNDPSYPFFVAGFFWTTYEYYIDRNIISIDSADWDTRLESTFFGTVAHEYQHLIHSDKDGDETSWINEGMSDFAEYIVGYGHPMGHVNYFLDHPENSLVDWDEYYASGSPETLADYGQAYLLQLYLSEQFGKDFVQALLNDEANGIESVSNQLEAFDTGLDFGELFKNFSTALAIDSDKPGNGIYEFESIDLKINFESAAEFEKDGVPAWGANYKVIELDDKVRNISFDGVEFLPAKWLSVADPLGADNEVLWANSGDEIDNSIVIKADLTGVDAATLTFDNFIDIEEQWDFGVVQVSADEGATWTNLANENTRSDIVDEGYPTIKENLPGFTGHYADWQQESFDLSAYAGQEIWVSFRYMTDWSYNDTGWFVDNISIPEIGYLHDGSSLDGVYSLSELNSEYVEYAVTFINESTNKKGKKTEYKVVDVDPFNVTEEDALQLRELFKEGKNYMIIWYAPTGGEKGVVDFTYEITTKSEKKIKK